MRPILYFLSMLLGALALAFFVHTRLLHAYGFPEYGNRIIACYGVNALLAAAIYIVLFVFRYKLKNYMGFLFMGGSFLKFIFFFALFYPIFKEDGNINRLEFAAFFVPYAICLVIETVFTAKMLKALD